jgi:hypothetical protein
VEYELVLPNATIARVNRDTHPDLMTAMKGSGTQFGMSSSTTDTDDAGRLTLPGIVTKFTVKAYPIGKVRVSTGFPYY